MALISTAFGELTQGLICIEFRNARCFVICCFEAPAKHNCEPVVDCTNNAKLMFGNVSFCAGAFGNTGALHIDGTGGFAEVCFFPCA